MTKLSFIEFAKRAAGMVIPDWQKVMVEVMENSEPGAGIFVDPNYPRFSKSRGRWEGILMQLRMDWIEGKKTELRTSGYESVHRVRPVIIYDEWEGRVKR